MQRSEGHVTLRSETRSAQSDRRDCATHDGAGKTGKNRNPSRPTIARGAGERPTGGVESASRTSRPPAKARRRPRPRQPARARRRVAARIRTEPGRVSDERKARPRTLAPDASRSAPGTEESRRDPPFATASSPQRPSPPREAPLCPSARPHRRRAVASSGRRRSSRRASRPRRSRRPRGAASTGRAPSWRPGPPAPTCRQGRSARSPRSPRNERTSCRPP